MVLNTEWAQVEVIDLINDGSGLAFGIIGGRSTGVVVKTILPGGVADKDGRLQSGDHILQIGEVNLRGLGSEQVASVLRQCGVHVRLVVARPVESSSGDCQQALGSNATVVPTKILGDPVELDKHLIENGYAENFAPPPSTYGTPYIYTGQDVQLHPISGMVDVVRNPKPIGAIPIPQISEPASVVKFLPLDMALREPSLPETEVFNVQLKKDDLGLGITVAGYVCEKEEISGIFVKSISKGSAADVTACIKVNDRIIEVDGKSVIGCTNHQAVELLRNTGPVVTISFERYLRGPKYEQLQQAIRANELRPPSPPSLTISSLPKVPLSLIQTSSLTIEPEGESRTSFDFDSAVLLDLLTPMEEEEKEIVIDGRKSVQFSIASHESILERWKDRLNADVQIIITELNKDSATGLGISLEGTVDVEQGQEVRPHHYVRSILPDGPIGRTGKLKSGDELLEVNGIQLMGVNHLEVVSILKQLPNFVSLVCARYPVPTRIINTAQHRDAFEERNILAESLHALIPVPEKLVKAKSDTSIVSSVASDLCNSGPGSKSRSLEILTGLPMWSNEATVVELTKGDRGLGFSILDYQDPLNPQETVIVIRSLVPGGVAQQNGDLIPGDRLLAVNDVNLEHASLDRAVQVLKGAPKGIVKISVAKPVGGNNAVSYNSQDTDDDDQTCLDEFQECIEEYQECLEVVHICFDEENSFSHSPCGSQVEDLGENEKQKFLRSDVVDNNYINNPNPEPLIKNSESEVDLSYKSLGKGDVILIDDMNNQIINVRETAVERPAQTNSNSRVNKYVVTCNDSSTLSDKMPSSHLTQSSKCTDEKDGYETCVDESLSEDVCAKSQEGNEKTEHTKVQSPLVEQHEDFTDETTPTNSKPKLTHGLFCNASSEVISAAISDPCISLNCAGSSKHNHIHLDSKLDDDCELKSYDNPIESLGADEFFLVQYPGSELLKANDVTKYRSEPNVLEMPNLEQLTYKKCLKEYYNDYEDCLELYRLDSKKGEMADEEIFDEIFLPFRSQSAPDVLDSSFVTLTYDPGPDKIRRKSTFVPGYQCNVNSESIPMTIIRSADTGVCCLRENQTNMIEKHWGSTHTVQIYREPNKSLGISIVGGRVDLHSSATAPPSETILGIFVKNVVADSPAGKTGKFKTGDRILEVSGIDLRNTTHDKAVDAIRNATNPVTFTIQSLTPWTIETDNSSKVNHTVPKSPAKSINFVTDEHVNNISDNHEDPAALMRSANVSPHLSPTKIPAEPVEEKPLTRYEDVPDIDQSEDEQEEPPKPVLSSSEDESDDDEEDVRHLEGRTVSAKGVEIDRASAGNVRRSKEETEADTEEEDDFGYTANKVKKKYASLGQSILMVQLERSSQGLGLSLAGHKDRNCMAVFVCGLNPKGAAFRTGAIQVGDEILEVNGVVLHGRCHLNASAIIKGLSGPIFKVIILRRKAAINDIAVKPITQFPVSLADEASEEQFNNYPNVRTVTIKKGSHSLGIMIIEGKHAEVGQGIFISDIQEGSSADKAGLEIGEMILAVNKDSLLGSNYDSAAGLLKRTEGLVTLVVSNPGKKASTPVPADGDKNSISKSPDTLKTTAPPSRPSTPVPEPPADPATCPVTPGKDVTLDVMTDNKGLGAFFVGGKDTLIPNAIVLLEIYPGGPADKDGRLQPGDQILEVNSASLKDVTSSTAALALRQTLPKMKLVVHRPEHVTYTSVEVDLMKKSGKGLGLSVTARKNGKGVYVTDILSGGTADIDGRIMKGDILVSVNGQDVQNSSGEEAGAILKTVMGKVSLKLNRYKPASR